MLGGEKVWVRFGGWGRDGVGEEIVAESLNKQGNGRRPVWLLSRVVKPLTAVQLINSVQVSITHFKTLNPSLSGVFCPVSNGFNVSESVSIHA